MGSGGVAVGPRVAFLSKASKARASGRGSSVNGTLCLPREENKSLAQEGELVLSLQASRSGFQGYFYN